VCFSIVGIANRIRILLTGSQTNISIAVAKRPPRVDARYSLEKLAGQDFENYNAWSEWNSQR
jgi:inosine-uridine nucleoside N-ribohydrolase